MALTTGQVALWRRNAVMAGGRTSSIAIKIMLARTIALADEVMANRGAQPVGKAEITKIAAELVRGDYLSKLWAEAEKSRHVDTHRLQNLLDELHDVMKVKAIAITQLLTAPPAPAVPGIDELRLTFERSERESDDGFNLHKYGIGYADEATQARWESWLSCRAAMLGGAK